MSPFDFTDLNAKTEPEPVPCWFVTTTVTWSIVAWSENLLDEVDILGYQTDDMAGLEIPDEPHPPLFVWEGTYKAVACGTYDGSEGGLEYELQFFGTFRSLTSEEAVALAAGIFEPGINDEIFNHHHGFYKHIAGAVKQALDAHGPITSKNYYSAAKRIIGSIRDWNTKQRSSKLLKIKKQTMHGKCWTCEADWGTTEGCVECEKKP
jgi:hypothetical protein